MAAGVPVVARDVPGTRDLIEHEATGYLFAPGHRAGFARWAEYLLNHPDAARRIGAAGRQRVESEFSVEKMIQTWREIIANHSSRGAAKGNSLGREPQEKSPYIPPSRGAAKGNSLGREPQEKMSRISSQPRSGEIYSRGGVRIASVNRKFGLE